MKVGGRWWTHSCQLSRVAPGLEGGRGKERQRSPAHLADILLRTGTGTKSASSCLSFALQRHNSIFGGSGAASYAHGGPKGAPNGGPQTNTHADVQVKNRNAKDKRRQIGGQRRGHKKNHQQSFQPSVQDQGRKNPVEMTGVDRTKQAIGRRLHQLFRSGETAPKVAFIVTQPEDELLVKGEASPGRRDMSRCVLFFVSFCLLFFF